MPATKEQIADVFERHVERFGLTKATVEDVAAELRISKKTIYEHFPSKAALYGYVVDRMASAARRELREAVMAAPTWGERLEVLVRAVLWQARKHISETSSATWHQEFEVAGAAFIKAFEDVLDEVAGGGLEAGEFAFPDPRLGRRLLSAAIMEYVMVVREDQGVDVDAAVAAAMRRFLG